MTETLLAIISHISAADPVADEAHYLWQFWAALPSRLTSWIHFRSLWISLRYSEIGADGSPGLPFLIAYEMNSRQPHSFPYLSAFLQILWFYSNKHASVAAVIIMSVCIQLLQICPYAGFPLRQLWLSCLAKNMKVRPRPRYLSHLSGKWFDLCRG